MGIQNPMTVVISAPSSAAKDAAFAREGFAKNALILVGIGIIINVIPYVEMESKSGTKSAMMEIRSAMMVALNASTNAIKIVKNVFREYAIHARRAFCPFIANASTSVGTEYLCHKQKNVTTEIKPIWMGVVTNANKKNIGLQQS